MGERSTPQEGVAFDPDRTAIVLIEFQRQWTDPGLYNLLMAVFGRNYWRFVWLKWLFESAPEAFTNPV